MHSLAVDDDDNGAVNDLTAIKNAIKQRSGREPLSLDYLIAKKKAEAEAESKVCQLVYH